MTGTAVSGVVGTSGPRRTSRRGRSTTVRAERGSAVADFVMVGALLTALFALVLQLVLALHVRNTLVDAASEGARFGALADRGPADAAARTRELITVALSARFAGDVTGTATRLAEGDAVVVVVRAPLPLLATWGPDTLVVRGHALEEEVP